MTNTLKINYVVGNCKHNLYLVIDRTGHYSLVYKPVTSPVRFVLSLFLISDSVAVLILNGILPLMLIVSVYALCVECLGYDVNSVNE